MCVIGMWQTATAAATGQWAVEWMREVRTAAGTAPTVQRGGPGAVDSPLPESGVRPLVRRAGQLPPLLCPSLQLSQSALGATDEVWPGLLQCILPETKNMQLFLTKLLSTMTHLKLPRP